MGRGVHGFLATLAVTAICATPAVAQGDICDRLEAQLSALDASNASPERARQLDRGIGEMVQALNAARMQYDRSGCRRTGFLFFQPRRPAVCDAVEARMRAIERDLRDAQAERHRAAADRPRRGELDRRQILVALTRHGCNGGYAEDRRNTVFGMLYGEDTRDSYDEGDGYADRFGIQGGTYRTLCVRACDGYYWPISFSTSPGRFNEDAQACQATCPRADVSLHVHRNPGEGIDQAISMSGVPYSALPNAFRYRKEFDPQCACGRTFPHIASADVTAELSGPVAHVSSEPTSRFAAAPLPRPRPEAAPPSPEPAGERHAADPADAPISRDGRPVRVIGPGFTYYRPDDG